MIYTVFDIETNGLLDTVSKIHCLSYARYKNFDLIESGTITDPSKIPSFMDEQDILLGHNIIGYDLPVLSKLLGYKYEGQIIDSLGLSWYLFSYFNKHGLDQWGKRVGLEKPKIDDWENLTINDYVHRCEHDVMINTKLAHRMFKILLKLYETEDSILRIINYINFKLECLRDQQQVGIPLDQTLCRKTLADLEYLFEEKSDILAEAMPEEIANVEKKKPKVIYKKDGELSAHGIKWFEYLEENDLPEDTEVVYERPNPTSHTQLKNWLEILGWQPETFKTSDATGLEVPQVSLPFGQGLCGSVKKLYDVEPALVELEGLFMIKHRISLLKGFLETVDSNGKVYSRAHGFTNTMRLQHSKPIVNLPGVFKPYGKEIRGCLKVPNDDYLMFGADVSSLEDNTKQHYIYFFDPDYVNEMRTPGFDPHLDIGILAGLILKEESDFYKDMDNDVITDPTEEQKARFKSIKQKRHLAKTTNFSATYGAGPAKIASTAKIPFKEGEKLHSIYWERNNAVKLTANACQVRRAGGKMWLYNPVSGFWMYLKEEKDKFSTLNQSTGVYVFDTWLKHTKKKFEFFNIPVCLQYHDELLGYTLKQYRVMVEKFLKDAMKETNEEIKLNVEITISVDWGKNYADCH